MPRILLIFLSDLVSFWLALFALILIRFEDKPFLSSLEIHLLPFLILCTVWLLVFYLFELYDLLHIKPTMPYLRRFGLSLLTCLLIGALLFYFVSIFGITPKTNLILQILLFGIISFALRRLIYRLFSREAIQPTILIGQTPYLLDLKEAINQNPQTGLKVVAIVETMEEALEKYLDLPKPIFIYESFRENVPNKNIIQLFQKGIEVIDIAKAYERYFTKIPINYINPSWIVEKIASRQNKTYDFLIRVRDTILATVAILITLPFSLISILLIYIYDGKNVFYCSPRTGLNGKIFTCYKFRSMYATIDRNPDATGKAALWHTKDDVRVTPIGKVIRKLHIDEIPQMLNVILGDMSLVGPRPERSEFVAKFEQEIPNYGLRHIIRPGFTGWAQIKYRYAHNMDETREKFEYDLYYIKNRNTFLDIAIIIKTIQIIFTH